MKYEIRERTGKQRRGYGRTHNAALRKIYGRRGLVLCGSTADCGIATVCAADGRVIGEIVTYIEQTG